MKRALRFEVSLAILVAFCGWFFVSNLEKPLMNWDMIAYVASAKAYQIHDPRVLHAEVYSDLRRSVPERTYADLTTGPLRQLRATDPESFRQHLPFFQIRVLYVGAILALWGCGIDPFFASHLVSVACAALAIALLAFLLPGIPRLSYVILVPFIARSSGFADVARYSTPDAMAVLAALGCYALLFRGHKLLLVLLPLCVAIRTDLLLLLPFFYTYLWLRRADPRPLILASAASSVVIYWGLNSVYHNYGWATVFDYTFSHQSAYPANYPHAVSLDSYLVALRSGLASVENLPRLLKFLALSILGMFVLSWKPDPVRRALYPFIEGLRFSFLSSLGFFVLHFMLFPATWVRFFAAQYALAFALATFMVIEVVRAGVARTRQSQTAAPVDSGLGQSVRS